MTNQSIQQALVEKFGPTVSAFDESFGLLAFEVQSASNLEVMQHLRDEMGFNFLTDLCGMHYPANDESRQFAVVYHMHNWLTNVRIRFKVFLPAPEPELRSATGLFLSANWQERETYDFFGIVFTGHPDLKRILNMDEMVSFPLRKEFPLEDGSRTDKDDRYFGRAPQTTSLN